MWAPVDNRWAPTSMGVLARATSSAPVLLATARRRSERSGGRNGEGSGLRPEPSGPIAEIDGVPRGHIGDPGGGVQKAARRSAR